MASDPEAVTLAAVFRAVDPRPPAVLRGSSATPTVWAEQERSAQGHLESITLADLITGAGDGRVGA